LGIFFWMGMVELGVLESDERLFSGVCGLG